MESVEGEFITPEADAIRRERSSSRRREDRSVAPSASIRSGRSRKTERFSRKKDTADHPRSTRERTVVGESLADESVRSRKSKKSGEKKKKSSMKDKDSKEKKGNALVVFFKGSEKKVKREKSYPPRMIEA
jgi:hypothetical protein